MTRRASPTKSERIRELAVANPKMTPKDISKKIGCLPEYVRVVLRQRAWPKDSSRKSSKRAS